MSTRNRPSFAVDNRAFRLLPERAHLFAGVKDTLRGADKSVRSAELQGRSPYVAVAMLAPFRDVGHWHF
jgi:hypothetical protein